MTKEYKPRYQTWLEATRTLTEVLYDEKVKREAEEPKVKVRKVKVKPFVNCIDCGKWITMSVSETGVAIGYCRLHGKCIHI